MAINESSIDMYAKGTQDIFWKTEEILGNNNTTAIDILKPALLNLSLHVVCKRIYWLPTGFVRLKLLESNYFQKLKQIFTSIMACGWNCCVKLTLLDTILCIGGHKLNCFAPEALIKQLKKFS
ncbi:hypothetical protein GQX74_000208 [Glossina fuscipes]|nr:hypothetical protein GQX74_000208 [Glossina fuscipes]